MIGTLSLDDLGRIRRMSRTDAESYLRGHTLTDEERTLVLDKLAGINIEASKFVPRGVVYDPTRPVWFVSAWLAGASWRQLAWLHGVTPQTIMASADKIMPTHLRQPARLKAKISLEQLSAYRAAFIARDWTGVQPSHIAQILMETDTDTEKII